MSGAMASAGILVKVKTPAAKSSPEWMLYWIQDSGLQWLFDASALQRKVDRMRRTSRHLSRQSAARGAAGAVPRGAVTLVEMLVVVSIIGLLAAILLPVLSRRGSRAGARSA